MPPSSPDDLARAWAGMSPDLPADAQEASGEGRVGSHWQGPVRLLRGDEAVCRMAARLFDEARRELLLFLAPPLLDQPEAPRAYERLRERGVDERQVVEAGFLAARDAVTRDYVEQHRQDMALAGRVHDRLPGKLILVDRRVALVSINRTTGPEHQALIVHHRGLILHLMASFEQHWEAGRPLG